MSTPSEVTRLLQQFGNREGAADELLPLVYEQLQAIAHYVRLLGDAPTSWRLALWCRRLACTERSWALWCRRLACTERS